MRYTDIKFSNYKFNGHKWFSGRLFESVLEKNPTHDDILDVADWFHTTPDNLEIEIKQEPIGKFLRQIHQMYSTYKEFPKDAKRTKKIMREIERSGKTYPVYVQKDDETLFVMEGRHRMVAFMLLGYKIIPVAYVSRKYDG